MADGDLEMSLTELVASGLLSPDLTSLDRECLVGALSRSELEQMAAKYNVKDWRKLRMTELVDLLLKKASVSPLGMFLSSSTEPDSHFKRQIMRVLGSCWSPQVSRMRLLAGVIWLTSIGSDASSSGPLRARSVEGYLKTELYNMLLVRRGELIYPAYGINRRTRIYRSCDELQEYLELVNAELRLDYFLNSKDYVSATADLDRLKSHLWDLVTSPRYRRHDVPSFLRRYTAPYRALRILYMEVDLLERKRSYSEAVALVLSILQLPATEVTSQACPLDDLGPCRVSRLLIRLLIDQGNHLKQPLCAFRTVQHFLYPDTCQKVKRVCRGLRSGLLLNLQDQLNKTLETLQTSAQNSLHVEDEGIRKPKRKRLKDSSSVGLNAQCSGTEMTFPPVCLVDTLVQAPKVHVSAPVNATSKEIGTHRPHYLWTQVVPPKAPIHSPEEQMSTLPSNESESHTLLLNVEQWTLRHYMHNCGYEQGIHSESRVYHLLFVLLFYDILFDDSLPDVFYSFRQCAPLDLSSDDFYLCRKESIEQRLDWLLNVTRTEEDNANDNHDSVEERLRNCWTAHHGERCLWVDWELLDSPKAASDLFWCLGNGVVHAVCRQLATDFRSWRSGLPDLVLWSPRDLRAKIVEVKGPGDHLSSQQIVWLDVLVRAGADVEICHVSAFPHKSLGSCR